MLLFTHVENIQVQDVVHIRQEDGDIIFSIKFPDGDLRSVSHREIRAMVESCRIYETRLNLARLKLSGLGDVSLRAEAQARDRVANSIERREELYQEIALCTAELKKVQRIEWLFDQLGEHFKAGLISKGAEFSWPLLTARGLASQKDPGLERFRKECDNLHLEKKRTIPREVLFRIMQKIDEFGGSIEDFKSETRAYRKGREYASRLGYSRRGSTRFPK